MEKWWKLTLLVGLLVLLGNPLASHVCQDFRVVHDRPQAQRGEARLPTVGIARSGDGHAILDETTVGAAASDERAISKDRPYVGVALPVAATVPLRHTTPDPGVYQSQGGRVRAMSCDAALAEARDSHTIAAVTTPGTDVVSFQTATVALPTYPYTQHLELRYDSPYTYHWLDWGEYGTPSPVLHEYELLVLENDYLRVTLLPELGGRIYQMIFKPTGHNELYQNPVIKPTHWGPPEQGWWLAAGGIEWCLPVDEHGYDWGEPWSYQVVSGTAGLTVTLRNTSASDRLRAEVSVYLPADRAYVAVRPRLENPTGANLDYKYWTNAMLAPGASNTVGADLHFIFNADQVTVHSRGDDDLPEAHQPMDWPEYSGRNYARLGNWNRWLGFFERPQAAADFVGVYDTDADEGLARVFPADAARGAKGFGMGWADPIDASNWTDDGSTYVEVHGGVAPTFWDHATLTAGQSLEWTEYWYPVSGIGWLSAATEEAALGVRGSDGSFVIGVHPTAARTEDTGTLFVWDHSDCTELAHWDLPEVSPATPVQFSLPAGGRSLGQLSVAYVDNDERLLAAVNFVDCLPPRAWVEPLAPAVTTTTFTVSWRGEDAWSGVSACDVQIRDGYEGAWTGWLTATTETDGIFTGTHGHTYFFRARAQDTAGNWGAFADEEWGQAFTTVLTQPAAVLVTSRKAATPRIFPASRPVSYAVVISNTGNGAGPAMLADVPPTQMVVLTETLTASSGPRPTYTDGAIRWTGMITPGSDVRLTYALSPAAGISQGKPMTNTAVITGSVLGPFVRRAVVVPAHEVWLPLTTRADG